MAEKTRREILQGLAAGAVLSTSGMAQGQFDWMKSSPQPGWAPRVVDFDPNNPSLLYHPRNCERCGDCVAVCEKIQTVFGQKPSAKQLCIHCGQCVANCWNDGITERFHLQEVYDAMRLNAEATSDKKTFVALMAPSVRASLGEMFPPLGQGADVEGRMVSAARQLGFDYVFDVTFGADLAVLEEAAELQKRLEQNVPGPMFSSCCPAWVSFAELFFPDVVPQLSTCKSPILMLSAVVKTHFAKVKNLDPKKIVVVAITPCTAKKAELLLPSGNAAGTGHDLDYALTVREFGWWLREKKVDFPSLPNGTFDAILGEGSGAAELFGNTGGVTEAVLRTLCYNLTGKKLPEKFFTLLPVRGMDGLRKIEITIGGRMLRIGVVHGTGVAREVLKNLAMHSFDFVEVMACRGGCIGGGGQPKTEIPVTDALRSKRMQTLYTRDQNAEVRLSYENPSIQALYQQFLTSPGSEMAKKLLHRGKKPA